MSGRYPFGAPGGSQVPAPPPQPRSQEAELTYKKAFAKYQKGGAADAVRLYKLALKKDPSHLGALQGLAVMYLQRNRSDLAMPLLRKSLADHPNSVAAHGNLAAALTQLQQYEEALAHYQKAIAIDPGVAESHCNLANVLVAMGRHEDAFPHYQNGLVLKTYPSGLNNFALALRERNRHREAIKLWRHAQMIDPAFEEAYWNESLARLAVGDFAEGWRKFEWRWSPRTAGLVKRDLGRPLWTGQEDLAGRTILLHAEQGFGDTLQFVRYVPMVAARGGRVVLEVQRPLVRLMESLQGVAAIVPQGEALPAFDLHCPLMSLPLAFGTDLQTIPGDVPYLQAEPAKVAAWQARLEPDAGFKVGLVWAGSRRLFQAAAADVDRRRSISLAHFATLAGIDGCVFVSLQKDDAARQTQAPPAGLIVRDWTDELVDFADSAALVTSLDLVITVDTAVAHLAGALAKPVWLLNRFDTCWRWLLDRVDSPWYPTLRQFRQPRPGDWDSVLAAVRRALIERLGGER